MCKKNYLSNIFVLLKFLTCLESKKIKLLRFQLS